MALCLFAVQGGEDPALSHPTTENLNALLEHFQYEEVRGGQGGVRGWGGWGGGAGGRGGQGGALPGAHALPAPCFVSR